MSRNTSRIEKLEAESEARNRRVRYLWKDVMDPDAAAATLAEAERLSAQGFTVMIASWMKPEELKEDATIRGAPARDLH